MKKAKILGIILFWLTLISPIISFALAGIIDEMHIFGVMVNMNVFLLDIKNLQSLTIEFNLIDRFNWED